MARGYAEGLLGEKEAEAGDESFGFNAVPMMSSCAQYLGLTGMVAPDALAKLVEASCDEGGGALITIRRFAARDETALRERLAWTSLGQDDQAALLEWMGGQSRGLWVCAARVKGWRAPAVPTSCCASPT